MESDTHVTTGVISYFGREVTGYTQIILCRLLHRLLYISTLFALVAFTLSLASGIDYATGSIFNILAA